MNHRVSTFYLLLFVFFSQSLSAQKALKPRGFAGFGYRALNQADADTMGMQDLKGVIVNRILPGTPAERAGFQVGDILKKYDDHIIVDNLQFVHIYQKYYANDRIVVTFIRNGREKKTRLILAPFPREKSDEVDIEYTAFQSGGVYLRAVVASPLNRRGKQLPALLIVSALGSPRLIQMPGYYAPRELAYEAARAGFRVLRFEQSGAGDSEGPDFRTGDFKSEVDDNLAALDYLAGREDVDSDRVFVYGESTGGITSALLASKRETAGCIVSCTVGRTYYERMAETLRLQGLFGGDTPEEIDANIKTYLHLAVSVALGDSLPDILRRFPAASDLVNSNGRIMDDRTVAYWRQQLNINLPEIYAQITEPALVVYAESDFLTFLACHEHIRDVLVHSGNPDVTLEIIPNLDHAYAIAGSKRESYVNYQTRNFVKNPDVYSRIVGWLTSKTGMDPYESIKDKNE